MICEDITKAIEKAEEEIRQNPGFEDFQIPKNIEHFTRYIQESPIVSFNITEFRSDTFIITKSEIEILNFPTLTFKDLIEHSNP